MGNIRIPVAYMPASIDACAFYRMYLPHLSSPGSDYYFTGWNADNTPKIMAMQRLMGKKIAVVQRQSSIFNLQALQNIHRMGLKIIYDLDDNLWNLPHGNPAKAKFEEHQRGFAMCAAECDLLTVSTRGLKTAASVSFNFAEKILVVPNAIDLALFHRKEIERDDNYVVIGWGGSNTHNADVREVFAILPEVLEANPQAVMEVVGAPAKKEETQEVQILDLKYTDQKTEVEGKTITEKVPHLFVCKDTKTRQVFDLPAPALNRRYRIRAPHKVTQLKEAEYTHEEMIGRKVTRQILVDSDMAAHDRFRFKIWVPIKEYPNRLASWAWDISIAPLEDNRFNNSKSNIKMLEAAALKIPCLVSPVTPYVEFTALGGDDLKWLLCHTVDEWKKKLTILINEPERRKAIGEKMYTTMHKYYNMEKVKELWFHAFKTVLSI